MFVRTNKRWGAKKSACVLDRLRLFTTVKEKDIFYYIPINKMFTSIAGGLSCGGVKFALTTLRKFS